MDNRQYDVVVIGAGLVGLASAYMLLQKQPRLRVAILEKETHLAAHQSGHNSGVIHAGIYYRPGTLKAGNCRRGVELLTEFCDSRGIPYRRCGKVIVATSEDQMPQLEELKRRGEANGVPGIRELCRDELRHLEPSVNGIAGLYSPSTGIIDFRLVADRLAFECLEAGGETYFRHAVKGIGAKGSEVIVKTCHGEFSTRFVVNCAGLHADRIANLFQPGAAQEKIIPFRGEYFLLKPEKRRLVRGLIYPVPDPKFPFLGVHLTRMMSGNVEAGPNAVMALAREGYHRYNVNFRDLVENLTFSGFWKMASRYWRTGIQEWARSWSKKAFTKAIQELVPEIEEKDLICGPSGVRAQLVLKEGKLYDDFLMRTLGPSLHVLNAPSPGATACLAIGEHVANAAIRQFSLGS